MKRIAAFLVLCVMLFGLAAAEEITIPELDLTRMDIPDNEAMDFLAGLGVGWNLGNTFDAYGVTWMPNELDSERGWTRYFTTRELIQAVADAGYGFIRMPVSWHDHVDADFNISEPWLDRVQEVADWAVDAGLYVIINTHHDEDFQYFYPDSEHYESSAKFLTAIWSQLAERFADYDEHIILESLNEPRQTGKPHEWKLNMANPDCVDAVDCINRLNQLFVDTVRAAGGRNADRYLLIPGYAASHNSIDPSFFKLPEDTADNRIIVAVHAYTPYDFALNVNGPATFTQRDRTSVAQVVQTIYENYIVNGIPAIISEMGAVDKNNLQTRVEWLAYYVALASSRGIPVCWWDNGAFSGNGEKFGLIDRGTAEWKFPVIPETMMKYKMTPAEEGVAQ